METANKFVQVLTHSFRGSLVLAVVLLTLRVVAFPLLILESSTCEVAKTGMLPLKTQGPVFCLRVWFTWKVPLYLPNIEAGSGLRKLKSVCARIMLPRLPACCSLFQGHGSIPEVD
jgi:hypothetical protein